MPKGGTQATRRSQLLTQFDPTGFQKRDKAVQEILTDEFQGVPADFDDLQFVGYILTDIKLLTSGQCQVTITIPGAFREEINQLAGVMQVPLHIDVQLWTPFRDLIEAENNGMV